MKKLLTLALAALFVFGGCSKYDDAELRRLLEEQQKQLDEQQEQIDKHNARIAALEALTKQLGDRLDAGASITSITALPDGAGWRIEFTKGDPIDILNGAKGETGNTPYIKEGNWWIGTTDTGVKAQGDKGDRGDRGDDGAPGVGTPGDDGDTPEIINGYWWIGGVNTGVKATGSDGAAGDSLIAGIVPDEANGTVTITLTGGGSFTFPLDPDATPDRFAVGDGDWYIASGEMWYWGPFANYDLESVAVHLYDAAGTIRFILSFNLPGGRTRLAAGTYDYSIAFEPNVLDGVSCIIFAEDGVHHTYLGGGTVTVSVSGTGDAAVYTIDVDCTYVTNYDFSIPAGAVRGTFRGTLPWSDHSH